MATSPQLAERTVKLFLRILAITALGALLGSCAVDAYSPLPFPSFMRQQAREAPPPDEPPAVATIVREQLDSIFVPGSLPHNTQVSPPHRNPRDLNWLACVKADVSFANGRVENRIYLITIDKDQIVDRRLSGAEDNCSSERFEPIRTSKLLDQKTE
jgi:hypothetical protein